MCKSEGSVLKGQRPTALLRPALMESEGRKLYRTLFLNNAKTPLLGEKKDSREYTESKIRAVREQC